MKPLQASFHPSPSKPKLELPPLACDAHFHVFGPQAVFPYAAERTFTPQEAPKEKLFALHAHLGIRRGVVVQSGAHGYDNRVVADAIAARPADYRGIALVPPSVTDDELRRLDAQGIRGARFNYMKHLGAPVPIAEAVAFGARLADLGWHLQVHMDSEQIEEMVPVLKRSAVPVVIDHMGRIDASLGLGQPAFRALVGLLQDERFWVKVSACERASRQGPPYADAVPFARKLVEEFGARALWGTDWPHPNIPAVPDDGLLVDLLAEIAPSPAQKQALLVDNPQRLYRFG